MSSGLKLAIIIFLLTLVVVVINPKTHKSIEISSSSNVVLSTDNKYSNSQDIKISNKDGFKDSQTHKINNVDGFKNTKNTFENVDNLSNSEVIITDKDIIDYEKNLMAEYRRRKALATKPVIYNSNKVYKEQPQQKIVLDPNYQKNSYKVYSKPVNDYTSNTQIEEKDILLDRENFYETKDNYKVQKNTKTKSLTKYEETIVWNKWKSDLHNNIHNDISYLIPDNMPLGALYKYSFVIDKNGNVSDINIKIIFPGISLDGNGDKALKAGTLAFEKAIRNCGKRHFKGFPKGSQRDSVKLELVVQMGFVNVYTKPGDFNDLEKVFGFR